MTLLISLRGFLLMWIVKPCGQALINVRANFRGSRSLFLALSASTLVWVGALWVDRDLADVARLVVMVLALVLLLRGSNGEQVSARRAGYRPLVGKQAIAPFVVSILLMLIGVTVFYALAR